MQTVSATTDSAGRFHFDSLYISAPPVVDGYQVDVDPDLPYSQLFHSPIHVDTGSLVVRYAINRADVFVVGEDSANYSEYYKDALISMGLRTSIWNIIVKGVAPFQRGREFKKNTVIYFSGTKHTPMRQSELDNLVSCLDVGCNLFLTGQDIVEKNDSSTLIKNYLSVHYGGVGTTPYTKGLPGDLFDGFGFYTIGEGASNQTSRDIIATADPRVKAIMGYGGTGANGTAGVRLDSVGSGGKAVVLGFGFEAINTSETRLDVMHQIIAYFDGSIILDVNDGSRASQPVRFKLDQNYPNPFNPLTSFSYWIAEKGHVTLRLFNILGEEVVKLVDDERLPGIYSVQWNAERCPTGVYLAQISVASPQGYKLFQASRKLLLMK
ncbi:MAG: T9SS type A sorting domain-containing protein [Ignavibacteriales bacterium]|nr:T9SS type A sorting domain-containing protein [Ignavibacteriales bacterium]